MASHGRALFVPLLVFCLLFMASNADRRRYLSVSMDELLSSKAHVDCPPLEKSVTTSGNKLTIPAGCGIPKCCGAGESTGRHVINHDINRLSTLLQRSSSVSLPPPAPLAGPIPRTPFFPFPPAPSTLPPQPRIPFPFPPISDPPVTPPSEPPTVTPFPFPPSPLADPNPRTPFPFPFPPAPSTRPFPGIPFPFPPAPSAHPFPGIPFPFPPVSSPRRMPHPAAQTPRAHRVLNGGAGPSALPFPRIPVRFPPAPSALSPEPRIPFPFPPISDPPVAPSSEPPAATIPHIPWQIPPAPSAVPPLPEIPFPLPPISVSPVAPPAEPPAGTIPHIPWQIPPAPSADPPLPEIPFPFPPISVSPVAPPAEPPAGTIPHIPWQFPPAPSALPPLPRIPFPFPFPPMTSPVAPPAEAPAVTIPDSSGAYLNTLEFVVTVGFGTPARPYAVMFDTGSDLSWIQCKPCSGHCYKQHDPIFDSAKSSTYAAVPCGHPECKAAGGQCDSKGTCTYKVEYGDTSSTSGVLSHERLSLTSSSALHNFVFGCAENNLGSFGDVDGLIGLGRGQFSLSSQAAASLGATFSYCLPSHNGTQGYLTIGSTPVSDKAAYTAMVQKPDYPSFYFVELVSINIGGYVLPVPPTMFTSDGTLLDSGTIITYLPEKAYALLRDRFKFTMKQYKPAPAQDILDTCYDFTGQAAIFIPAVSFKFSDGAVFDLDFFGVLLFPDEETAIGCLAFAARPPTMPFNIVGNTQQRSAQVIYDVAKEKIGFVPASC